MPYISKPLFVLINLVREKIGKRLLEDIVQIENVRMERESQKSEYDNAVHSI